MLYNTKYFGQSFYILGVIGLADLEHCYDLVMVNWSFKVYEIEINLFKRILEK